MSASGWAMVAAQAIQFAWAKRQAEKQETIVREQGAVAARARRRQGAEEMGSIQLAMAYSGVERDGPRDRNSGSGAAGAEATPTVDTGTGKKDKPEETATGGGVTTRGGSVGATKQKAPDPNRRVPRPTQSPENRNPAPEVKQPGPPSTQSPENREHILTPEEKTNISSSYSRSVRNKIILGISNLWHCIRRTPSSESREKSPPRTRQ